MFDKITMMMTSNAYSMRLALLGTLRNIDAWAAASALFVFLPVTLATTFMKTKKIEVFGIVAAAIAVLLQVLCVYLFIYFILFYFCRLLD